LAKRIRVYELARELGMDNKGALDLCIALGIEVKSHSSSIEDAQADRVRRKAERDGLKQTRRTEESSDSSSGESAIGSDQPDVAGRTKKADKEKQTKVSATDSKEDTSRVAEEVKDPLSPLSGTLEAKKSSRSIKTPSDDTTVSVAEYISNTDQNAAEDRQESGFTPSSVEHGKVIRSRPASELSELSRQHLSAQNPFTSSDDEKKLPFIDSKLSGKVKTSFPSSGHAPKNPPRPAGKTGDRGNISAKPPTGPSGKPIPPPPGSPLTSLSGKPIPPPPGMGGRGHRPVKAEASPGNTAPSGNQGTRFSNSPRPPSQEGRPATYRAQGSPTQRRSPTQGAPRYSGPGNAGPASARPSTNFFGSRSAGSPPPAPPSGSASRGAPGSRGGRPPQKKSQRRRRNVEELEPIQVTAYSPSSAPIPEGEIIIERGSTPQDVGPKLNRSAGDVIRFLFLQGEVVTATQSLTDEMIDLFALELGAKVVLVDPGEEQEAVLQAKFFADDDDDESYDVKSRPAVVTVMGHVDHGKTLLLDRIRRSNVVQGEAGGITQHIGAYQIIKNNHAITFIDTPGHEAFTQMRARGAQVTDIVILVVAADDGVMPQTIEAINHAKAANVPIIVALNKIDRADSDPNRVLQQLSEHGLVAESWGGDTITVEVSALQDLGVDDLLEQVAVLSEVLELRAPYEGKARAVVLESNLDIGRGSVATAIVQRGTLRVGDPIVAGSTWGKVKALINDTGDQIKEAFPSTPVQILGLSQPPGAGDEIRVTADLATAKTIGEQREQRARLAGHNQGVITGSGAKLEDIFEQIQRGETATLTLVLKADVQGSLEAVTESLRKLEREDIKIVFVQRGVGGITENDVQLATASRASILGFNVRPSRQARELAEFQHVEIRTYEVIYKLIEEIESAMLGMLAPVYEEVVTGDAEVREIFRVPKIGAIAGCYVQNGTITRGSKVRFLRDGVVIWKGTINSLKRFKEDTREVQAGFECGIGLSDFSDLKSGDIIETYEDKEIPRPA